MYMKEKNGVIVGRLCYGYEHEREKYCYCSRKYPTAFLCFSHCVFSILMPFLWSTTFCVFPHPDKWNVWLASRNGKVCIQCLLLSAVYEYLIFWLGHRQYPSPWININELLRMKYFQIDKSKVIPHPLWEIAKIYLLEGKEIWRKGEAENTDQLWNERDGFPPWSTFQISVDVLEEGVGPRRTRLCCSSFLLGANTLLVLHVAENNFFSI